MQEVLDIIMALIEQIPWFASLFIVCTVYFYTQKATSEVRLLLLYKNIQQKTLPVGRVLNIDISGSI